MHALNVIKMIENCVLLGSLAALAWIDVKKKELPISLLGTSGAAGLLLCLLTKELSLSGMLGGMCIGGILCVCALVSRDNIGLGDGFLFVVTGIYLGLWGNLVLLFLAVISCAAAGGILVLLKKCTRKQTLPFAPFVLAADVALLLFTM